MPTLTFLIPVRHPKNSPNWARLKANLSETLRSVSAQSNDDWRGLVIANEGADLPPMPAQFAVEWVHFPPNQMHERRGRTKDEFLDAFRIDKGQRVLKGMLRARDSRFFMIVDDDDFVSSRVVDFVAANPHSNGWTVDKGYIWDDGGSLLMQHDDFSHLCGTSLIVRSDHYGLPERFEDASADYIKTMLGSHVRIGDVLAKRGTPLAALPFRGAIYRVGHSGSHSQAPTILRKYFFNRQAMKQPRRFMADLLRLRMLGSAARREFFGSGR